MLRQCVALAWGLSLLAAQAAGPGSPLATLAEVETAHQRAVILWDVRPAHEFRAGHIPGAVSLPAPAAALRDANSERLLSPLRLESMLGQAGIDPAAEVIVYGRRGSAQAYFGRHALLQMGAASARVFHDGVDGWRAAGRPLQTGDPAVRPRRVVLAPSGSRVARVEDVVAAVRTPGRVQLLDVRSRDEHVGADVRAIRGGHIPGSINIPHEANWVDPHSGRRPAAKDATDRAGRSLKDRAALNDLYAMLDPDLPTIVYCHSGTRAAVTAAVLEDLGFRDVRVYTDSWLGYAARLDLPAASESFVNVGRLTRQLDALKARLDAIERRRSPDPARADPS